MKTVIKAGLIKPVWKPKVNHRRRDRLTNIERWKVENDRWVSGGKVAARLTGIADTSNWLSEGQDGRPKLLEIAGLTLVYNPEQL